MTEPELIRKKDQAQRFFLKNWPSLRDHVDDFGQYCVILWLSKKRHPEDHYLFLCVDYLRAHVKRVTKKGTKDLALSKYMSKLELTEEMTQGKDSAELARFENSEWIRHPKLEQRHRIVLILYYEWGMSLDEIGDVLGFKKARVSQLLGEAKSVQEKRMR